MSWGDRTRTQNGGVSPFLGFRMVSGIKAVSLFFNRKGTPCPISLHPLPAPRGPSPSVDEPVLRVTRVDSQPMELLCLVPSPSAVGSGSSVCRFLSLPLFPVVLGRDLQPQEKEAPPMFLFLRPAAFGVHSGDLCFCKKIVHFIHSRLQVH